MWKPADLRLDFIQMNSGGLDKLPLEDLKALIMYHDKEVVKVREKMSVELWQECDHILSQMEAYYDIQEETQKEEPKRKKKVQHDEKQRPREKDDKEQLTPTELYKLHFGENPSQVFRKQVDKFDKAMYSRWLREQTRPLRNRTN